MTGVWLDAWSTVGKFVLGLTVCDLWVGTRAHSMPSREAAVLSFEDGSGKFGMYIIYVYMYTKPASLEDTIYSKPFSRHYILSNLSLIHI